MFNKGMYPVSFQLI